MRCFRTQIGGTTINVYHVRTKHDVSYAFLAPGAPDVGKLRHQQKRLTVKTLPLSKVKRFSSTPAHKPVTITTCYIYTDLCEHTDLCVLIDL